MDGATVNKSEVPNENAVITPCDPPQIFSDY